MAVLQDSKVIPLLEMFVTTEIFNYKKAVKFKTAPDEHMRTFTQ